jgi:hypothetical protein
MRALVLNIICLALLLIASVSRANVTIEVLEPQKGKFLVTYEIYSEKPNSSGQTISGLSSIENPPEVLSVIEKNSKQQLDYDVFPIRDTSGVFRGRYKVKANYKTPIPAGQYYIIEYRIILYNKKNCFVDQDENWVFQYETTHSQIFFILPKDHAIIYSNFSALIYEEDERTVVQAKICSSVPRYITKRGKVVLNEEYRDTKRTMIYKTRSFAQ